jgi:hypothetical protein
MVYLMLTRGEAFVDQGQQRYEVFLSWYRDTRRGSAARCQKSLRVPRAVA